MTLSKKSYECTHELINMNHYITFIVKLQLQSIDAEYSPSETCELLFQVAHFFLFFGYFVLLHTNKNLFKIIELLRRICENGF